jgi:alkylhydroperoxidase family enzyme
VIRNMEIDKIGFSEKEKRLFTFALKCYGDPKSLTDEDFSRLREVDVTDQELVEITEVTNLGDAQSRFADVLRIGGDNFLTY